MTTLSRNFSTSLNFEALGLCSSISAEPWLQWTLLQTTELQPSQSQAGVISRLLRSWKFTFAFRHSEEQEILSLNILIHTLNLQRNTVQVSRQQNDALGNSVTVLWKISIYTSWWRTWSRCFSRAFWELESLERVRATADRRHKFTSVSLRFMCCSPIKPGGVFCDFTQAAASYRQDLAQALKQSTSSTLSKCHNYNDIISHFRNTGWSPQSRDF